MCDCKNIGIGTHDNTIILENPFYPDNSQKEFVTIDKCLKNEILFLWVNGIQTLNSCCGHNKLHGNIIVVEEDTDKMYYLGYDRDILPYNPKLENCFYSKTQ